MKREEKRRKFHESLLNVLYPPPPPPPQQDNQRPMNLSPECLPSPHIPDEDCDLLDDDEEKRSSSSSDGNQKPTRARRKRLRKKKLREAASQRRPIIGPLLPSPPTTEASVNDPIKNEPPGVRHNAAEEPDRIGEQGVLNKLKQRRMAKKQIRDKKDSTH